MRYSPSAFLPSLYTMDLAVHIRRHRLQPYFNDKNFNFPRGPEAPKCLLTNFVANCLLGIIDNVRPNLHIRRTVAMGTENKTSFNCLGHAKRRATKIRRKAVGGVIFGRFSSFDACQPNAAGDVISGAAVEKVGIDVLTKFGDSRLNSC